MSGRTGRPTRRRLIIDWALVEQRRIAAGMTHAHLAERVGAGPVTGPARLWTDRDHDTVPLAVLERLCQVLDLHPSELFRAPTRAAQRQALRPPAEPSDAAVVEAALATLTTPPGPAPAAVSAAGVAEALGWTLQRLEATLAMLDDQLAERGIRIDREPAATSPPPQRGLRARDRCLTAQQRHALHRLRELDPDLDADTARVLAVIAYAPRAVTEQLDSLNPAAILALQQRGLIRRHAGGGYLELSDDARDGLFPQQPPDAT